MKRTVEDRQSVGCQAVIFGVTYLVGCVVFLTMGDPAYAVGMLAIGGLVLAIGIKLARGW